MDSTSSAAVYKVQLQGSPPPDSKKEEEFRVNVHNFETFSNSPKVTKRMAPPPRPFSKNQRL
jgi:hypothetical protein